MNLVEPIKNPNDIKKIIEYLRNKNIMYSTIFQVGIYSGLRVSDILGLDVSDVENKDFITVREQKTGKYKKFPIKDNLKVVLEEYLVFRKEKYSLYGTPLFVGSKHHRLHRTQVYREINQACRDLNISGNFGTHTMRKTFGYHHYKKFNDVVLLQKIFNHSSPAVTLRYIGIEQEEINNSYADFNYDFSEIEKNLQEKSKKRLSKTKGNFKEIQNSLDYLFNLYTKLDKKLDKISVNKKDNIENTGILEKIKNYLNSGGLKHRDFCLMLLANES